MSWTNRKRFLSSLVTSIAVVIIALEGISCLFTLNSLFLVNEIPKLYKHENQYYDMSGFWSEKEEWGAWHKPNSKISFSRSCFTVEMESNEVGARDKSFTEAGSEYRYVLIGDSFAEGYGVSRSDTAAEQIAAITKTRVLNFGTAGNFGPVQYALIYEKLANRYRHDGLIIFFLPANDFSDNDYEEWTKSGLIFFADGKERYRPYYQRISESKYSVFYPKMAQTSESIALSSIPSSASYARQFLIDYFWTSNALRTMKILYEQQKASQYLQSNDPKYKQFGWSGYFDPTIDQQKAAVYFIDRLVGGASTKEIVVVSIPTQADIANVTAGRQRQNLYWWRQFHSLRERLNKPVIFIDLLDYAPHDVGPLFQRCDGHWSLAGNRWAAEIISKSLRPNK